MSAASTKKCRSWCSTPSKRSTPTHRPLRRRLRQLRRRPRRPVVRGDPGARRWARARRRELIECRHNRRSSVILRWRHDTAPFLGGAVMRGSRYAGGPGDTEVQRWSGDCGGRGRGGGGGGGAEKEAVGAEKEVVEWRRRRRGWDGEEGVGAAEVEMRTKKKFRDSELWNRTVEEETDRRM